MSQLQSRDPKRVVRAGLGWSLLMATLGWNAFAQTQSFSWEQLRDRFQANNPTLRAAQISIDESRAQEITAYLRPNPDLTGAIDQINPFSTQTPPNGGS